MEGDEDKDDDKDDDEDDDYVKRIYKIIETWTVEYWLPDYILGDPNTIHYSIIEQKRTVDYIMVPRSYKTRDIIESPNILVRREFRGLVYYEYYRKETTYIYGP